jgi:hypothetical protein
MSSCDDKFTLGVPKRDINNTRSVGLGVCILEKIGFGYSAPKSYFFKPILFFSQKVELS